MIGAQPPIECPKCGRPCFGTGSLKRHEKKCTGKPWRLNNLPVRVP